MGKCGVLLATIFVDTLCYTECILRTKKIEHCRMQKHFIRCSTPPSILRLPLGHSLFEIPISGFIQNVRLISFWRPHIFASMWKLDEISLPQTLSSSISCFLHPSSHFIPSLFGHPVLALGRPYTPEGQVTIYHKRLKNIWLLSNINNLSQTFIIVF